LKEARQVTDTGSQPVKVVLSEIEVSEDPSHYTRAPDKPLQLKRLLLIVKGKRPGIAY
jgi:hypothetical protein